MALSPRVFTDDELRRLAEECAHLGGRGEEGAAIFTACIIALTLKKTASMHGRELEVSASRDIGGGFASDANDYWE